MSATHHDDSLSSTCFHSRRCFTPYRSIHMSHSEHTPALSMQNTHTWTFLTKHEGRVVRVRVCGQTTPVNYKYEGGEWPSLWSASFPCCSSIQPPLVRQELLNMNSSAALIVVNHTTHLSGLTDSNDHMSSSHFKSFITFSIIRLMWFILLNYIYVGQNCYYNCGVTTLRAKTSRPIAAECAPMTQNRCDFSINMRGGCVDCSQRVKWEISKSHHVNCQIYVVRRVSEATWLISTFTSKQSKF